MDEGFFSTDLGQVENLCSQRFAWSIVCRCELGAAMVRPRGTGMKLGGRSCGQEDGEDIVRLKSMYAEDKRVGGDET